MTANPVSGFIQHLRRVELLREAENQTDGQLLEGFVSRRDGLALEVLVLRHAPMVWGVCRRVLSDGPDAEDAFQTTFLVFARKAASIRSRERLANWLYGVAQQTARKAKQTVAKRKTREQQVAVMPEPKGESQDQEVLPDLQPVLDEELSRLPDKYRTVLVLSDLQGKGRPEVARQLGLLEGTVGSRLARGREMLAKRLALRGVSVSGVTLAAVLPQQTLASVPTAVLTATIQGISLLAPGGRTVAGAFSAQVLALTEGVLKTMLLSRWKWAAIVLLTAGVVCAAGLLAQHLLPAQRGDAEQGGLALTLLEQADYPKYGTEEDAIAAARFVFLGGSCGRGSPRARDQLTSVVGAAYDTLLQAKRVTYKAKLNPETGRWTVSQPLVDDLWGGPGFGGPGDPQWRFGTHHLTTVGIGKMVM
jgi:RNA polymerase sigma factor (sigma-70 family)